MIKKIKIIRIIKDKIEVIEDSIIQEFSIKIIINERLLANVICSPEKLEELVFGYLFTAGIIESKSEIDKIIFTNDKAEVILTNFNKLKEMAFKNQISVGCGGKVMFVTDKDNKITKSDLIFTDKIPATTIFENMHTFQSKSKIFEQTGGVHSAALIKNNEMTFAEDIGRHNAVDKVIGKFLLEDKTFDNTILMLSGRVSSEILRKITRSKIPIVVSRSAPTDIVIELCRKFGITLIGFVRGKKMNIYSGDERIEY